MDRRRLVYLDHARAVGIVLVVLGHALRSAAASGLDLGPLAAHVDHVIYAFHMPLFFMLAGMTHALGRPAPGPAVRASLLTIAWPYLLWSAIWIGLKALFAARANTPLPPGALAGILVAPVEHFWFLYVLFFVRLAFTPVVASGSPAIMRFAVLAALVVAFTGGDSGWDGVWSPWLLFWAAFYGVGLLIGDAPARLDPRRALAGAIAAAAGFAALVAGVPDLLDTFGIARTLAGLCGSLAVILLLAAIPERPTVAARFAGFIGEASLAIFLTHTIIGVLVRVALGDLGAMNGPLLVAIATVLGVAVPAYMHLALVRLGRRFGWPFATIAGFGHSRPSAYLPLRP